MPSAWPTLAEVQAKLTAVGVDAPGTTELQAIIDGAVLRWEQNTNWDPFLAESGDSTTLYDPPAWRTGNPSELDLRGGYVSLTTVTVDKIDGAGGTVLTSGSAGFYAWPENLPIRTLRFPFVLAGPPQSIEIVGKRGYSATVPADAWKAVLDVIVGECQASTSAGSDMQKLKQGPLEITYKESLSESAARQFERVAARYRRITF